MIAHEDYTWIGQKVVARYHHPIENGDQTDETQNRFRVYTVDRVDGERLCVKSGGVNGWIPISQALLFDQAIDFYTQQIAANPDMSRAWSERGIIWYAREEFDKAILDFNEAIHLNPTNARAYGLRGVIWAVKNEYEKAFTDFNTSIELDSTNAAAYTHCGYGWLVKAEYDKAIGDFNDAVRFDPKDANAYGYRGIAWLEKEEYDKAIADFNEAARLNPTDSQAYKCRGRAWQQKNDITKALADYKVAIRLDPKDLLLVNQWEWLRAVLRDGKLREREKAADPEQTNGRTTTSKTTRRMSRTLLTFLFRCWLAVSAPALGLGCLLFWNLFWRLRFASFVPLIFALVYLGILSSWVRSGQWRPSLWLWVRQACDMEARSEKSSHPAYSLASLIPKEMLADILSS